MCGSGTFLIEAAQIAADRAPGLARSSASRSSRSTTARRGSASASARTTACRRRPTRRPSSPATPTPACSSLPAQSRGGRASPDHVAVEHADALERGAPASAGIIVANPPYGVRLESDAALAALYPKLGDALKQRFAGWTAWLLTGDARLPKLIGLKPSRRTPLFNGAIECRFYRFELVEGRPRRTATDSPLPSDTR